MVDNTSRFGLNTYSQGDTKWDHTDTVQTIDELAIERGAAVDRPSLGDYDDELYLATDQQILYRWDADATDWIVEGVGSETDPLPKVWANEIDATSSTIDGVESPYATDSHDNTAHSETFAVDGDAQPPETHDNDAHSETFAVDGDAQPPETHDNDAHSETFAVDGDAQPPETHDNDAHSETFAVDGDEQPPETHDNTAHSETFAVDGDSQPPESHGRGSHADEVVHDGDNVDRQIWVIESGADDPDDAGPDDLIFEQED